MSKRTPKFSALRLFILALVAGAVGSAIAIYVNGGVDGNRSAARSENAVAAAETSCIAKTELAQAVAKAAVGEVAAMLPAERPVSLRDLTFAGPDGQNLAVSDFSGKAILINLWATWCTPCREEMPALDSLQASMGSDRFEVVAVNVDRGTDEKPQAFLSETGIKSLAYYRDSSMRIFNDLKSRSLALGLPVTLLVDENGCLLAHMNGPAEWGGADAKRLVEAAINSDKASPL